MRAEAVPGEGSRAKAVASCGLRTSQDYKDLGAALVEDILLGDLDHRVAGNVARSAMLPLRYAEHEVRVSNGETVRMSDCRRDGHDAKIRELESQLASLRASK